MAENSSTFSLVGTLVIAWPVLSYMLHSKLMDSQHTLGLSKKKEYDPVLVARLSVAIGIIAVCGLVLSFFLAAFDISQEVSYVLIGSCGITMWFIPFRKSLKIIRNQNTTSDDDISEEFLGP